jgi:hypothetical protein
VWPLAHLPNLFEGGLLHEEPQVKICGTGAVEGRRRADGRSGEDNE